VTSQVHGAAPVNDRFANRITISGTNVTVSGSNTNATKEAGEPDHAGNAGGKSVWWTWTAPDNGEVRINTDGSSFDSLLAVYTGTRFSDFAVAATNDDHGVLVTSSVRFQVAKGTNYLIAVDGFNTGSGADFGSINLSLAFLNDPIVRPPNDNFNNRIALVGFPVATNGFNVEATRESGEPYHADKAGDTSVWWTWTAPTAMTVAVSTEGSGFDTLLAIYTGTSVTNLTLVASDDDLDPAAGLLTSVVAFAATNAQVYQIAVDGFDGSAGQIALRIGSANPVLSVPLLLPDQTFQMTLTGP
jgi:hypothetical protein